MKPEGAEQFHAAISASKTGKYAAAVYVYPLQDYRSMRTFISPDGHAGAAVKSDGDLVSVFKIGKDIRGAANSALAIGVKNGGTHLDAFDTILPDIYAKNGFRAVARLAWDDKEKPPDWNYETFKKWNNGRPDVVFMVYDPEHAAPYKPGDGKRVATYGEAKAAQQQALAALKRKGFDPNEPRDSHGRWTEGGGDGERPSADVAPEKILLINSNPTPARVKQWKEQLEQQSKEVEFASKAYNEIGGMQGSLNLWTGVATPKDKESGRYGIYTINDIDGKLLAATTTRYDAETKVGEIIFASGTDHDAKVKSLNFTVQRYSSDEHKADRLQGTIVEDDAESRAAYEEAGFRAVTEPGKGYTEMVWGHEGKTTGEFAKERRLSAEHAQSILGAGKASAIFLDYDPNKIKIGDEYNFAIGEKSHTAAGTAHPDGTITLYPSKIWDVKLVPALMSHEVMHQKYRIVQAAYEKDRQAIASEPGPPPNPNSEHLWERQGGNYAVMKPDGSPRPPYDKKYPLYADMIKHHLSMDLRAKSDGVTAYSKEYWDDAYKGASKGQKYDWTRAMKAENETLAEMASVELETKKLPGKPAWRAYYKSINHWYDELRKVEQAAKAA